MNKALVIVMITLGWSCLFFSSFAQPNVQAIDPVNGSTDVSPGVTVRVDFDESIDPTTLTLTGIRLKKGEVIIPSTLNSDLSNSAISISPDGILEANTQYTLEVTDQLIGLSGLPAVPFSASFITGFLSGEGQVGFEFNKVKLEDKTACTSLDIGPDGHLYVSFVDGTIKRYVLDPSTGQASTIETLVELDRQIISLIFDPDATTSNIIAWLSYSTCTGDTDNYTGTISRIRFPAVGTNDIPEETEFITGLPHSEFCQHQPNGLQFSPEGILYQTVGGVSTFGKENWGQPETLLSAALIYMDVKNDPAFQPQNLPVNVKTADPINYDPYANDAPVKIHSTGFRNMLGLVFHSNGNLYGATNQNSTNQLSEPCNGIPAINAKPREMLFNIKPGRYYGHQNLSRGECVHNGGNPTSGKDPFEITAYPVGTQPNPNFDPDLIYDIRGGGGNSANGMDEFKGPGVLNGRLLVAYFTGTKVIQTFEFDSEGKVIDERPLVNSNNQPIKFTGALDVAYHPVTHRVYVADFGLQSTFQGGSVYLLDPITNTAPPPPPAGATVYQAEDYSLQNGTNFSTRHNGYNDRGFMDYGGNGTYIEWNGINAGAGEATLTFRYANGSSVNRSCTLFLNGQSMGTLDFPTVVMDQWGSWGTLTANLTLPPGPVRIRVMANSTRGGPNLDQMEIAVQNVPDIPVTGISLEPAAVALNAGEALQLQALISPENATNQEISWSSDDPAIGTVSNSGIVTAVASGDQAIASISINEEDVEISEGGTVQLTVSGQDVGTVPGQSSTTIRVVANDAGFTDSTILTVNFVNSFPIPLGEVIWTSSDPEVVGVENGLLTALSCGSATITATSLNGGQRDSIALQVSGCEIAVTSLMVEPSSIVLDPGESAQISGIVTPTNATDPTILWESADPSIATVSSSGLVTALAPGGVAIKGISQSNPDVMATSVVTVTSPPILATYQGEDYTQNNDSNIRTRHLGYTGSGYIDYGQNGSYIEWNNVTGIGRAVLTFRYANGSGGNRSCTLWVNGQTIANLDFGRVTPGNWASWGTTSIEVDLDQPINTVRVVANSSSGGPNLDKMDVELLQIPDIAVQGVELLPEELNLDGPDGTAQLTAQLLPGNATNQEVLWTIENEAIANVDQTGRVSAVIGQPLVEGNIQMDQTNLSLDLGSTVTLTVSGYDVLATNASDETMVTVTTTDGGFSDSSLVTVNYWEYQQVPLGPLTWVSSDPGIASVDNGVVTGLACGNVTISVSNGNGLATSIEVLVGVCSVPVSAVIVEPELASLTVGSQIQLSATVNPTDATNSLLVWDSSDEAIATVDQNGLVTTISAGNVLITATSEDNPDAAASSELTVFEPTTTTYQAENYSSKNGGGIRTQFDGYTGSGYVDYGGLGTWIEWNNVDDGSGLATLTFRYANGSSVNRSCDLIVNGETVGEVLFPTVVPNQWFQWGTVTTTVNLDPGNNTIRVRANTASGGPNLDKMDVTVGGSANTRWSQAVSSPNEHETILREVVLYPNPVDKGPVKLMMPFEGRVTLYNAAGSILMDQYFMKGLHHLEIAHIPASLVLVTIEGDGKVVQKTLVIR